MNQVPVVRAIDDAIGQVRRLRLDAVSLGLDDRDIASRVELLRLARRDFLRDDPQRGRLRLAEALTEQSTDAERPSSAFLLCGAAKFCRASAEFVRSSSERQVKS